jgi:hypothetical protein
MGIREIYPQLNRVRLYNRMDFLNLMIYFLVASMDVVGFGFVFWSEIHWLFRATAFAKDTRCLNS